MKNALKPLGKSVLMPSGLTATASVRDATIYKKIIWSGRHLSDLLLRPLDFASRLSISNKETNGIMKIAQSIKESGLLVKTISETIQNKAKKRKGRFLSYVIRNIKCQFIRKSINR